MSETSATILAFMVVLFAVLRSMWSLISRLNLSSSRAYALLFLRPPKLAKIELKDLGENDIVVLEIDYLQLTREQGRAIFNDVRSAMTEAREGIIVLDIPKDICKVSIIKRSPPKLDNSDLNELLEKAIKVANTNNGSMPDRNILAPS